MPIGWAPRYLSTSMVADPNAPDAPVTIAVRPARAERRARTVRVSRATVLLQGPSRTGRDMGCRSVRGPRGAGGVRSKTLQ